MTGSVLLDNIGELVTNDPDVPGPLGLCHDAAMIIAGEKVAWIGPGAMAPAVDDRVDCRGRHCASRLRRQPFTLGLRW